MLIGRVQPFISYFRRFCSKITFDNVVFSGIQPTGVLHLGNYYGAVEKWLQLQNDPKFSKIYISVVDLHAFTIYKPPNELSQNVRAMVASLLACGIDPERTVLFQQSAVSQHGLLAWILATYTTIPQLSSVPNFKEKAARFRDDDAPLSLLSYPVLQAADILLYKATHVPVGDDQTSHMHLVRKLVFSFNVKYKIEYFPKPETIQSTLNRVKSLRDPTKKMSKSDDDAKSRINLDDTSDEIRIKFRKALTDMTSRVTYEPESRPGVANLINIHSAVSGKSANQIVEESVKLTTLDYKLLVGELVGEKFAPIREKFKRYYDEPTYLNEILSAGNAKAAKIAEKHVGEVRKIVGMSF